MKRHEEEARVLRGMLEAQQALADFDKDTARLRAAQAVAAQAEAAVAKNDAAKTRGRLKLVAWAAVIVITVLGSLLARKEGWL